MVLSVYSLPMKPSSFNICFAGLLFLNLKLNDFPLEGHLFHIAINTLCFKETILLRFKEKIWLRKPEH